MAACHVFWRLIWYIHICLSFLSVCLTAVPDRNVLIYISLSKNDSTSLCSSGGVRCKMSDVAFSPCRGFSLEIVLFPKGKSHHRTRIAQTLSPVNYTSIVVLFRSFNTHRVPEVCVRVCQIQTLHCFTWAHLWCTDVMLLLEQKSDSLWSFLIFCFDSHHSFNSLQMLVWFPGKHILG